MATKKVTQAPTCPENKIIPNLWAIKTGDIGDLEKARAGFEGFMNILLAAGDEYPGLYELLEPHMELLDLATTHISCAYNEESTLALSEKSAPS